jgi:hypothetical protein
VNVNGNSESERMTAFVEAVSGKSGEKEPKDPKEPKNKKHGKKFDDAAAADEIAEQLAKLRRPSASAEGTKTEAKAEHGAHSEH